MQKGLCKHHRSSWHNKTCLAGVCYRDVTPNPDEPGCALRQPCRQVPVFNTPDQLAHFERRGTCDKYEEPTQAELDAYELKIQAAIQRMEASLPLIDRVKKEHRGQDWQGVEECPICKGKLFMTHAKYNGHVHGKCETEGCLSWME